FFLGLAYFQAQDPQRAQSEFVAAVQNDNSFLRAYVPLADLTLRAGDADAAIRYARQALTLNANLDDARLLLVRAYIVQNNYQAAAAEVNTVLSSHPGNPLAVYHQGLMNLAQGNLAQAESQIETAFKALPDQSELLATLSSLYLKQNRPDKAIQRV